MPEPRFIQLPKVPQKFDEHAMRNLMQAVRHNLQQLIDKGISAEQFRQTYLDAVSSVIPEAPTTGGSTGSSGLSVAEVYIYRRSATPPATPVGGSYSFAVQTVTPPTGWTSGIPNGTDPVYVSVTSATSASVTGVDTSLTWSVPVKVFSDGADGQAVDMVFRRSAGQPVTPDSSVGVPDTPDVWYTDVGSVPASSDPLWSSVGTRASPSSNWVWQTPIRVEGAEGAPGINTATLTAFKRSAAMPVDTPGALTYIFADASWTPLNGWSKTVPAGTDPVWAVAATAYSNTSSDVIESTDWSAPVQVFANGDGGVDGLNVATVFIYQRTTADIAPIKPSVDSTYTFATGGITGLTEGWTATIPDFTGANPYLWVSTATAANTTATDVIASAEWADPRKLAQNGADGTNGLNAATLTAFKRSVDAPLDDPGDVTYTFATAGWVPGNGWSRTIPAGTSPVWAVSASAVSDAASDEILAAEWSTPVQLSASGADGLNVATVYLFQRTDENVAPALPSVNISYVFATGVASNGGSFVFDGWTQALPNTGGQYRWMTQATASSTAPSDVIDSGEWAAPAQIAADGSAGSAALNIGRKMDRLDQWFDYTTGLPLASPDWTIETVNGPVGELGMQHISNLTSYYSMRSEKITFDRTKKHRVSFWAKQTGDRLNIPFVQFYDAAGAILGSGSGSAGWPLIGAATHNLINPSAAFPSTWTLYTLEFGGDATATTPTNAKSLSLGGSWAGGGTTLTTLQLQDYHIVELAADGTDGIDALSVSITPTAKTIAADSAGVIKAGELPIAVQITAYAGTTDVTTLASYTTSAFSGLGATNNGNGSYTINTVTLDSAYLEITVTYAGAQQKVRVSVDKARDGSTASSAIDQTISNVAATTYDGTVHGGPLDVGVGPLGTITASFNGTYIRTVDSGSVQIEGKFQYREKNVDPGWTDMGAVATGTLALWMVDVWDPRGNISFSRSIAGPATLKLYEFRLLLRVVGGTVTGMFTTPGVPNFTVSWQP